MNDFNSNADRPSPARADASRINTEITGHGGTDPFAAVVRATRMPIIVTDPRQHDNPVIFANDAFCRLTGYAREEIDGRNCRFLQGTQTDPAAVARVRAAVEDVESIEIDIRNYRKDGEPFWNRLLMAPVHDANGELAYSFASLIDVTFERDQEPRHDHGNKALTIELASQIQAHRATEARRHQAELTRDVVEQSLRLATEVAGIGTWDLDLDADVLTWSDRTKAMFGISPDAECSMADFYAGLHPDDVASTSGAFATAIDPLRRTTYDVEYRTIGKEDGVVRWVAARGRGLFDERGRCIRAIGTAIDITARRAEQARLLASEAMLAQSEAKFRAITDSVEQMIWSTTPDGVHDFYNQRWYDFTGVPPGSTSGDGWKGVFHPADAPAAAVRWEHSLRTGDLYEREYRLRHSSGQYRWVLGRAVPMRDDAGRISRWFGTCTDIQEIVKAREVLARSRDELEHEVAERTRERDRTWNNSQDLLLVIDLQGVFCSVNPAWTTILGWLPEELIGRSYLEFIHPDDHPSSPGALASAGTDKLPNYENRYRHRDGGWRWIEWAATPDGGRIYASGRDVTAEKEAAAALVRAEAQLRQAQKMEAVGQLTGGIAHDFNNLLTGIVGALELIQRRVAEGRLADLPRYASVAVASANRAAALTQRLLAFARRQPLDPKPVDANRLVAGMEDLLRRTLGPATELEMVLAGGLWPTLCDVNQLESAILNLAINARDAMPGGGRLTIETGNAHLDDAYVRAQGEEVRAGQYIAIAVTDTGAGMDAEVLAHAFEPFFTTKPIGEGTGLGLSMLYGFIRQSGGHVRIYSELGRGTTFRLYLPRHRGELDAEPRALARETAIGAGERVLVVDDEAGVRMVVTEVLEEIGYTVIEAVDGASGLQVLQSDSPLDLLITDVGLPAGLNGRQLADAARELRPGLKVLFITGFAGNAAVGHGVLEHGMHILTKPFAMDALAAKVRKLIAAP